ncbi:MAG: ribosome silencing factor [Bacteroidales bacterium]|nr:ribosome silencing factor [Bacteroidales bacterium]MDD3299617.1 ribosome silencing factor [Bacteroidales bacterium]MDD3843252.1 ribosome silencing factor [Bacteroidales bacterium]MDD4618457.1 ribosome silencing factor [Bacteroidales bacterium]
MPVKKKIVSTETENQKIVPAEVSGTDKQEIKCIADAMLDKKASFVCSLDLRSTGTAICDYFVICNADSTTQVMAIADNVEEMMHTKCNRKINRMQGKENAFWVIIDYGNIVVHIFQTEYRQFYRLEDLWADAEKTTYQD